MWATSREACGSERKLLAGWELNLNLSGYFETIAEAACL
jgi:hypothetical protein